MRLENGPEQLAAFTEQSLRLLKIRLTEAVEALRQRAVALEEETPALTAANPERIAELAKMHPIQLLPDRIRLSTEPGQLFILYRDQADYQAIRDFFRLQYIEGMLEPPHEPVETGRMSLYPFYPNPGEIKRSLILAIRPQETTPPKQKPPEPG